MHDHPREYKNGGVVKMDVFHSMWRSRTVADPWGADTPACETILLHHEQFKISENLARFAVKHGMWGFVKKLASTVPVYVEARRKRVDPHEDDPQAYGAGEVPNPPALAPCHLSHSDSAMSLAGMAGGKAWGECSSECGSDDSARPGQGHAQHSHQHSRRMRQVATALVVGGVVLAVKVRGGAAGGSASGKAVQQRRHQRRRQQVESHRLAEVPEVIDE